MLPRVYIETTIPSFYYEIRKEPHMVARRGWTRDRWDSHRLRYEIVTSVNALLGLHVPILTTPLELIQEPEEYE